MGKTCSSPQVVEDSDDEPQEGSRLIVEVVEAKKLNPSTAFKTAPSAFVEVSVFSQKSFKRNQKPKHFDKTIVLSNTPHPVWHKEIVFEGNPDDFYMLALYVKDKGFTSDSFIGGACVMLSGMLNHTGKGLDQWLKLAGQPTHWWSKHTAYGDIRLKLQFIKCKISRSQSVYDPSKLYNKCEERNRFTI